MRGVSKAISFILAALCSMGLRAASVGEVECAGRVPILSPALSTSTNDQGGTALLKAAPLKNVGGPPFQVIELGATGVPLVGDRSDSISTRPALDAELGTPLSLIASSRPLDRRLDSGEKMSESYAAFRAAAKAKPDTVYATYIDGTIREYGAREAHSELVFESKSDFGSSKADVNRSTWQTFNGSQQIVDVWFGAEWRTLLVGGYGGRARGIFAVDITEPRNRSSASASEKRAMSWEFNDESDADIGSIYAKPQVAQLHNGRWAIVVGNGYGADKRSSANSGGDIKTTALFIVDAESGQLIRKISTSGAKTPGSHGLGSPAMVDVDGDRIADFAYAGDLDGNLWKFDLQNKDPANWKIAYSTAGAPAPFFSPTEMAGGADQPIVEKPVAIRGPIDGSLLLLFGTGAHGNLRGSPDPARRQAFFGLLDRNTLSGSDRIVGRSSLQEQTILDDSSSRSAGTYVGPNADGARATSSNAIDWSKRNGWYLNLGAATATTAAEWSNGTPRVRAGRLVFTTFMPSRSCGIQGNGWLMMLDAWTGARPSNAALDFNDDRASNEQDLIVVRGTSAAPSGLRVEDVGEEWQPVVVSKGSNSYYYFFSGGRSIKAIREFGPQGDSGRQSWRQLR